MVHLDETWINAHFTTDEQRQLMDGTKKRRIPAARGQRLIITHVAIRKNGLVQNAELVFEGKARDGGDYHTEMNCHCFTERLVNTLLPALDQHSCLVMDNAACHNGVAHEEKV